jgi:hypothetical protein
MFRYEPYSGKKENLETEVGRLTGLFSKHPATCDIGVELELEGFGAGAMAGHTPVRGYWVPENDPSLRGDSIELVLRRPVTKTEFIEKAIPEYIDIMANSDFRPALSRRCSLHVHLDFSRKSLYSMVKFFTLYSLLEPYFFEAVGPGRKGNQFCIALDEAPNFVDKIVTAIQTANFGFFREDLRYMALNLCALNKFGSVEIRLHDGEFDPVKITRWVKVLYELVDYSVKNFDHTPAQYLEQASMKGLDDFIKGNLPLVWELIGPVYDKVQGREHLNVAQDIAYSLDWSDAPKEYTPQPKKSRTRVAPAKERIGRPLNLEALIEEGLRMQAQPVPGPFWEEDIE